MTSLLETRPNRACFWGPLRPGQVYNVELRYQCCLAHFWSVLPLESLHLQIWRRRKNSFQLDCTCIRFLSSIEPWGASEVRIELASIDSDTGVLWIENRKMEWLLEDLSFWLWAATCCFPRAFATKLFPCAWDRTGISLSPSTTVPLSGSSSTLLNHVECVQRLGLWKDGRPSAFGYNQSNGLVLPEWCFLSPVWRVPNQAFICSQHVLDAFVVNLESRHAHKILALFSLCIDSFENLPQGHVDNRVDRKGFPATRLSICKYRRVHPIQRWSDNVAGCLTHVTWIS